MDGNEDAWSNKQKKLDMTRPLPDAFVKYAEFLVNILKGTEREPKQKVV